MQAWLTEPSLYMVYSFDLLNVHVRVKIEQRKPHNFQFLFYCSNHVFTLYCTLQQAQFSWAFVEHLILVIARPCDQLSYTFYGSIHNNQQWCEMNLFCLLYLFHLHSRGCVWGGVWRLSTTFHSCHLCQSQLLLLLQFVSAPPSLHFRVCSCHTHLH